MSVPPPTDLPHGAPASDDSLRSTPRAFGQYVLLEELGRGAQGVVYLAEHATLHRKVALKLLTRAGRQSQSARDRFRREAELTVKVDHPGICGVHDFGEVDGVPFIAMQYVRGTTLSSLVEKARADSDLGADTRSRGGETISIGGAGKGGLEDVLRLVERAARALHVAHEAGLVHRDVKPANVMVTPEGHPVLLDFGLARDLESEGQGLTQSGQILGTPAYLAPEQIVATRGAVDRRTDVYALGVTLFECLTLRRPFEAASWDGLFHEILDGAPRSPRKLNPRIPHDLATVIEVAMDRDPARRYASAGALAEDLRRVRSFEPIRAQPAGPITRLRKWARRSPGRAASAAAAVIFVACVAGLAAGRIVQRERELRAHLDGANAALASGDHVAGEIAASKALELEPDSAEAIEIRARLRTARSESEREAERGKALAAAQLAREEGARTRVEYASARARIDELGVQLAKEQSGVFGRYATDAARSAHARRQSELEAMRVDAERTLLAWSEALESAARLEAPWGGASEATRGALADFYLERWREAVALEETARAAAMRTAVESYDPRGEHTEELLGRGTLALEVEPRHAELHLFRFEDYATVRGGDVIPRLVPVPTTGVGRARDGEWTAGFHPGDPCLVVRAVETGSIAARAGLARGDLVLRCAGSPAVGALLLDAIAPDGPLARAGAKELARVTDVDGASVQGRFDWSMRASAAKQGALARVGVAGVGSIECDMRGVAVVDPLGVVHRGSASTVRLDCLRGGAPLAIEVPSGELAGLRCETTAYPLVLAAENRVEARSPRTVDPGSYLVVARAAGYEDQRFHVVVGRRARVAARIELLPAGSTPEGFVHVPAGPFVAGGDARAFKPVEGRTVVVPSFFLARKELTNAEWYEFVNDPPVLERIAAAKPGEHALLPQDDRVLARRSSDGARYEWDVYTATSAESPVLGLSWNDVREYLAWRNARAERLGEAWRYDLPSELEWEKAARGVDARAFPWGDRFDPSLAVCVFRKDGYLLDAPGGFEPRDESPFGVLDMAGSREEWLRDEVEGSESPRRRKRGGHWSSSVESLFRSASGGEASPDRFASTQGVRLVARKP